MAKKKNPETGAEDEAGSTIAVTVVAKQESRMRAGLAFSREPRSVEVTEKQLEAIKADPMLAIVAEAAADPAAADPAA